VRWVQHWAAGVDAFTQNPDVVARGFRLTNTSGIHSIPISEHILAFLLALGRGLTCALQQQAEHVWYAPENPCRDDIFELSGKTMVLIGVGAIGSYTAEIAAAFGVHVIGVRRDPSQTVPSVAEMVGPGQLHEVLPQADFVVLTVPLTDATRGMIGEPELRAMKPSAIIVNIGRGETIEQSALIRALQEGWIGGAGLDVFEQEPLPADSPLWELPNVIVTSHYAGHTPHYDDRAFAVFTDNLRRYVAGQPLRNVIDMVAGY
jgi:phosphoglycerate dehydrogenase-like enzyme